MQLKDKTVFITGGAGGMGTAFAKALLEKGANVIIADIDATKGSALVEKFGKDFGEGKAIFIKCDVSCVPSFQGAFQAVINKVHQINIMVNNAGIVEEVDVEKLLRVNLHGTIYGTELALAHMRKDRGGHGGVIINLASTAAYAPTYFAPAYAAAKHGVLGYTKSLAAVPNLHKQGVRYGLICPALTDTPLVNDYGPSAFREEYLEDVTALLATTERIDPKTVAEGLLSLIADDDSNGALLAISTEEGLEKHTAISALEWSGMIVHSTIPSWKFWK